MTFDGQRRHIVRGATVLRDDEALHQNVDFGATLFPDSIVYHWVRYDGKTTCGGSSAGVAVVPLPR
jgi:hypothetical protein